MRQALRPLSIWPALSQRRELSPFNPVATSDVGCQRFPKSKVASVHGVKRGEGGLFWVIFGAEQESHK